MRHKLRLGLLIGDWTIPAWQHDLMAELLESDYASIDLVIQSDSHTCKVFRRGLAVSIYEAFQRYETTRPAGIDACEIRDAHKLLSKVDRISFPSGPGTSPAQETASIVARIKPRNLDVILALDDVSSIDSLVDACQHGVWFYDFGYAASAVIASSWIGFLEVLRRAPFIHSALMIRSARFQNDQAAYRSYSAVNPLSHALTRSQHLWKIRAFVPRVLRELYIHGENTFLQRLQGNTTDTTPACAQTPIVPNGFRVLISSISYAAWRIKSKIARRYIDKKWILMFQIGGNPRDLTKYITMRPPEEWFWADPFVVRKNDHYYIFFEEAAVTSGHGHLAVIRMDDNGNYSQAKRILEKPYHLSYPFIFEWKRALYMIPETADNRTIEVYKCKEFPHDWEFQCNLMEGVSAYDATLFEHNDTWWLFANIREHDGASSWDELFLFSASHPLSDDWQPHPMNPIVSDVRHARPAGRIFRRDGKIYRPSQNSSHRYGYALNFNEIIELSRTTYKERLVECLEPDQGVSIDALHSYNESGELTVIDAVHRTRRVGR